MDRALLFREGKPVLVTAQEVLDGKYSKDAEYVDAEYPEYKVSFVRAGKPPKGEMFGTPYFRLYYSYEDYKELFPDRADKYEIVCDMRRYQETKWHREWKEKLSPFCETEKYFKHNERWKFADAYCPDTDTCIELQHSYTSSEFDDRNKFYKALGKKMVWLFHLPKASVKEAYDGMYEILEDNAKGFFRAAYESDDVFTDALVFIQTKSKDIYKVHELLRRKSRMPGYTATVRCFKPEGKWNEDRWIKDLKSGRLQTPESHAVKGGSTLKDLWKDEYKTMIVYSEDDVSKKSNLVEVRFLFRNNQRGGIQRDFNSGCIRYQYHNNSKFYHISRKDEDRPIWHLVNAKKLVDGKWLYGLRGVTEGIIEAEG